MNQSQLPSIELIQGTTHGTPQPPSRGRRRWIVFFSVLLVTLAVALAFVYGRSPIYRASASVLTVKPKDVDRRSVAADLEHTTIQGRLLLSEELLGRLSERLVEADPTDDLTVNQLRNRLDVVAVRDTNLLELRADGADPGQLQRVVNSWTETYEHFRAEEIAAASGRTIAEIEDEQANLETRIEAARTDLQAFRAEHDIVSLERSENRSLSSLKGLNDSLNKARERLIEAEARKAAVDAAIADGKTVVPDAQKADIAKLRLNLQRARARLKDLRSQYTEVYIASDPNTRELPQRVNNLEQQLRLALRVATETVGDEAGQAVEAARLSVDALEQKLQEQQQRVQTFTEHFKEFKRLEKALAELEKLHTNNATRLAQIEVRNLEKYPPIQVVEWARLPHEPIYPHYQRDLMVALAGAVLFALFVTWLLEYLSGSTTSGTPSPAVGVRIFPGGRDQALTDDGRQGLLDTNPDSGQADAPAPLEAPKPAPQLPRELAIAEVQALLAGGDERLAGYATLLLNGVSPYELPMLHSACFERTTHQLWVPGACDRRIPITADQWQQLQPLIDELDAPQAPLGLAELNERLAAAASGARLTHPESVDALALWHSYVVYLVRQGIDTESLTGRVGALPPDILDALRHLAPPGGHRPPELVAFSYPALEARSR